jgi:hypothetical protein
MPVTSLTSDFQLYKARRAPFLVWYSTLALVAAEAHHLYLLDLEYPVVAHGYFKTIARFSEGLVCTENFMV